MPQPPPQPTQGPAEKVPCPHCQQPMNFTAHLDTEMGSGTLEVGAKVDCDRCGRSSKVLAVRPVTIVRLSPL